MQDNTENWDLLLVNANLATCSGAAGDYGIVENAALAIKGTRIAWLGPMSELPDLAENCAHRVENMAGRWLTPGLIDCHTHLVFAGDRAVEFERRLSGTSYEEIARSGGGIMHTVRQTRAATEDELLLSSQGRLVEMASQGLTTVEIKSGYGLNLGDELKMLRVARRLAERFPVGVRTSLLAAHALAPEYAQKRPAYIDLICQQIIPAAKEQGLADAVDAFCEGIGFSVQEVAQVFEAAEKAGLRVKLHADQLSDLGGAALAAQYGALSADHLEHANLDGLKAMKKNGTVPVLLPAAFYFLQQSQKPPIGDMRSLGMEMAVASDCNPGSSPINALLTVLNMACVLFGLTPVEALRGMTVVAARALGIEELTGSLVVGKRADLAIWQIDHPAKLAYWVGPSPCRGTIKDGDFHPRTSKGVVTS